MEDDKTCSAKWPRYALYTYSSISVLVGGGLIGLGVYFFRNDAGYNKMFSETVKAAAPADIDLTAFIYITSIVTGCCMILSSISLAVCGAYKMNRSCIAAYMTFAIFGFMLAAAVGITFTAYEPQFEDEINIGSQDPVKERTSLNFFMKILMILSLCVAAFQMVGVVLSCCLQRAIEDINKL